MRFLSLTTGLFAVALAGDVFRPPLPLPDGASCESIWVQMEREGHGLQPAEVAGRYVLDAARFAESYVKSRMDRHNPLGRPALPLPENPFWRIGADEGRPEWAENLALEDRARAMAHADAKVVYALSAPVLDLFAVGSWAARGPDGTGEALRFGRWRVWGGRVVLLEDGRASSAPVTPGLHLLELSPSAGDLQAPPWAWLASDWPDQGVRLYRRQGATEGDAVPLTSVEGDLPRGRFVGVWQARAEGAEREVHRLRHTLDTLDRIPAGARNATVERLRLFGNITDPRLLAILGRSLVVEADGRAYLAILQESRWQATGCGRWIVVGHTLLHRWRDRDREGPWLEAYVLEDDALVHRGPFQRPGSVRTVFERR